MPNSSISRSIDTRSTKPRRKTEANSKTSSLTSINSQTPSKIPVYTFNNRIGSQEQLKQAQIIEYKAKHSLSAHQLSDLPEDVKLMHMVHCHCNHSQNNMPRSKTHEFNGIKGSSVPSTLAGSPGTFTPKDRKSSNASSAISNGNKKGKNKGNPGQKSGRNYEEYLPLCEMQKGLEKGEIVEGILRINPKNYNDAYISAPEGGLDIFIGGLYDRNRALNGDHICVKLHEPNYWTLSASSINSNWEEWKETFQQLIDGNPIGGNLQITRDNLKLLNSQDLKKIEISAKGNATDSLNEALQNEFPNVPLVVFSLGMSELNSLSCSSKFIQRSGKVVYITVANHSRIVGGTISIQDKAKAKLLTSDCRVPHVMIPFNTLPKDFVNNYDLMKDNLFLVHINDWKEASLLPKGTIIQALGKSGELESEIEVLLRSNDIDTSEFPQEALQEYDLFSEESWKIPEKEYTYRRDFREECVFTIDPQSARDLDDAISLKELPSGLFEVGVHIADVSYFIREDTMLDSIAKRRATSVYMPSRVIPMLPHLFCQHLCSLNPGQDKLTFSVVFTMDAEGNVKDSWIGRTVINSCAKLSYEHAQKMIDASADQLLDDEEFPQLYNDWPLAFISGQVKKVNQIAQTIRQRRFATGSLRLDKTKLGFILNDDGMPVSFSKYVLKDSNRLIEELMLLANKAVAERLYDCFAKEHRAFLRGHPPPNIYNLNEFVTFCKRTSIKFDITDSLSIYNSLQQIIDQNPVYFRICSISLIKAMKLAAYICVGSDDEPQRYHHYALNFEKYTHFTSPIRRYADVMVHRLLCSHLGYESTCTQSSVQLSNIAENCNLRKYNAFIVSEKSNEVYLKAYISSVGSFVSKAIVILVQDHSFDVLVLNFDIVCRVYVNQLPLKKFDFIKSATDSRLMLTWDEAPISGESEVETGNLQQAIFNLLEVEVQMCITADFTFDIIVAHPNGDFIRSSNPKANGNRKQPASVGGPSTIASSDVSSNELAATTATQA